MFETIQRLWRHRRLDERDTRRMIDPLLVQRLTQRVHASEQRHSGEIRLCIEASLPNSYLRRQGPMREIIRQRDLLNQILVERTGQPLSRIEEDTDRDVYMTAQAAVDYGLIDGVLDPPDKGESKAQAKSEGKSK